MRIPAAASFLMTGRMEAGASFQPSIMLLRIRTKVTTTSISLFDVMSQTCVSVITRKDERENREDG